jgi:acyl-coenzyme A thioesterase PaaI-like protein
VSTLHTAEFKINLVAPTAGERIVARGCVIKAGRTLTLAQTEAFSETAGEERLVALLTATLMTIESRVVGQFDYGGRHA